MCARTRRGSAVLLLLLMLLMLIAAAIVTQCIRSNTIVATLVLLLPVRSPIRSRVGLRVAVGARTARWVLISGHARNHTQLRRHTQAQA